MTRSGGPAGFLLVLLLLQAFPVAAADGPGVFTVTADTMRSLPDKTIIASGNVTVTARGVILRAAEMSYDPETYTLTLSGQVTMQDESGRSFTGESLVLDVRDMTGGVKEGTIRVGTTGLTIRGRTIERIGEDEYRTRRGVITSCGGDCPDWSFVASDIFVRREGYLVARNAAFRICDVPIFYTPYLVYPVMTRRQTGFLFPQFGFTEETGLETALPFYLVLGPSADATLTPRIFTRDRNGIGSEVRYRLHHEGGGDWYGFSMTGGEDRRWYWSGEHAGALAPGVWLRGRWAATGEPDTRVQFGETFDQRNPGAVFRHLSLDATGAYLKAWAGDSSLITDASLAGQDDDLTRLDSARLGVAAGPVGGDQVALGLRAESTRFEEGGQRDTLAPWLDIPLYGPRPLAGRLWVRNVETFEDEGTRAESGFLTGIDERLSLAARHPWGRHDLDLFLSYGYSQEARFSEGSPRDGEDGWEKRSLWSGKTRSNLTAGALGWDLEVGFWKDTELDLARGFGFTALTLGRARLEATRNRDAGFGMVLPSLATDRSSPRGWSAQVEYGTDRTSVSLGKESSDGSPDILTGSGRAALGAFRIFGAADYDQETETISDETLSLLFERDCWNLNLTRYRTPDRTDWNIKVELKI